jgi:hypothetical protein
MLRFGRIVRVSILVAGATSIVACAKRPDAMVGVSDPRVAPKATADAGADAGPTVSPELASYKTTMQKLTTARVPSVGHASGRWDIDVWCNESGCEALTKGVAPKEGAAFAVEHTERASTPIPGPTYFMEKKAAGYAPTHGDFRYVVVGARGGLVFDGPGGMCADCHDEAPRERLFPVGVAHP